MSLKDLFYDPKVGLSSALAFMKRARQAGYSSKEITDFIKRQKVAQIHKEVHRPTEFFPLTGRGSGSYQMDFMFMYNPRNRKENLPILNIINNNSRKLYAYVLKDRSEKQVLEGLNKWLNEVQEPPQFLQSDNEKAFTSKKVGDLLGSHDIIQGFVEPEDHRGQGIVERVHQTLRRLFTLYEEAYNKPWLDGFQDLVYNYNHRVNRSIGMEPAEATEAAGSLARLKQYLAAEKDFKRFRIGDKVRKQMYNKDINLFDKGRTKWSKRVYTITGTNGYHLYQLNDDSLVPHYELQLIHGEPEEHIPIEQPIAELQQQAKKAKKSTRALNKESIKAYNTAGQREAPMAEKRQARKREVYVAVPSNQNTQKAEREALRAQVKKRGPRAPKIPDYVQKQIKVKGKNIWLRGKVIGVLSAVNSLSSCNSGLATYQNGTTNNGNSWAAYANGYFACNTNNCNTLTALAGTSYSPPPPPPSPSPPPPAKSSATLVKPAAGIIAATAAAMFI
jgi:Integrase core domain